MVAILFRIREFDQALQQYQLGERSTPKTGDLPEEVIDLVYNNKRTEATQLDSVLRKPDR
jgi:hypothetical protein